MIRLKDSWIPVHKQNNTVLIQKPEVLSYARSELIHIQAIERDTYLEQSPSTSSHTFQIHGTIIHRTYHLYNPPFPNYYLLTMNQTIQAQLFHPLTPSLISQSIAFFLSPAFWYWHGLSLTISWFGVAFIAILIKKKYHTLLAKITHTLLFLLCNIATFFVNTGAIYRTYLNWHRFGKWGVLNKTHKLAGVIFTLILVWQIVSGIMSFAGKRRLNHKKYGYMLTYFAMLITISGLILEKHYWKGLVFSGIFVLEYLILREGKWESKPFSSVKMNGQKDGDAERELN